MSDVDVGRRSPHQELITVLQLGRRARETDRIETLGFVIVNETLQLLDYRQAMLWMPGGSLASLGGVSGNVCAISGVPQAEANAPYVQWLNRLGQYCFQKSLPEDSASFTVLTANDLPNDLAEEWPNWLPTVALWLPLRANGHLEGGVLFAREENWQPHEQALLSELMHSYAHALVAFTPRHHRVRQWLKPSKQWVIALAALSLLGMVHVRLSVVAPAEVVPQHPFLIRAPLEGVIDRFLIQPNQTVTAGTVLFNLEPTMIQSRFESAQKAYDTAQEEYRQAAQLAVTDDKSRVEMAITKGRLDEKAVELSYSSEQLGRLQVKAARNGVAVFSDVNQWQGKAVTVGERILMLADPGNVELMVYLPAADSIPLEAGALITLYPNATPTLSYTATLQHMTYRAEPTAEGILAYRIKAKFSPGQALPRIGQMGTATVYGERVSLAYYIFRRPFTAVRQWWGW
ncbi:MAG: HlyD family efflux transporter periplasmic adaptor subunit [Pseudomonadota bacterium]